MDAQMFSVASRNEPVAVSHSYIKIGTTLADFRYTGNLSQNPGAELLEFNTPIFAFSIEKQGFRADVALGNRLTGIKDGGFYDMGLTFTNQLFLFKNNSLNFGFPLQLNTGVASAFDEVYPNRFNQVHFAAGTGVVTTFKVKEKVQFNSDLIAGYGFSNSNGFFGGTMSYLSGRLNTIIHHFINGRGLIIGYEYFFRTYDIDVDTYDYDLTGHQLTLGISF